MVIINKTDLWTALKEYPEARKMLIQKGREILRKDNLLDENAPEENKTAEEIADELQTNVRLLQQKIARLVAERISTDEKLKTRIAYLESKLIKYEVISESSTEGSDDEEEYDNAQENVIEKNDDGKIVEEFIVPSKKDV
uniref:Cyclic nucleotide-gated channel C-terminal leucine zipper domain-containing protein n=1 Tax=Panagrolaimus sp. PS1159 TaxID=55785 RepID=A0AC35GV78_9BILA